MFPLHNIAIAIQFRDNPMHHRQTAEERIATADFRGLFPNGLTQAVKGLSRSHNNTAGFAILGNNLQHLRREVFRLVRTKPILHFINTGNHALNAVLVTHQ